ncbi:alpha/beta hydrolase [Actinomadura macrotermitis]|uniref:AB hydrolase-1 domain-containing protein n=1 Tax=Actinomadura macrotermitis TaxID=2585200 RepID=A0A7K0BZ56_9ACTN|nr:alpha/beta fold hydrolase [Actinomadura macrotermitis]MQY06468.1 hypothetical protein [Actinomadura macrotermitis]
MFTRQERRPELSERQGAQEVRAVVLLLPGGSVKSHGRPWAFLEKGLRTLAARIAERGADAGVAVHLLRYRYRGWNDADTAADARWALAEIERRYGKVPVALVGNSLGGRAAFAVAGEPAVVSVTGVAPWLPEGEPVEHLAGRRVLILHGDKDRSTASAALSLAYAERAREITPRIQRCELPGDGHFLLKHADDCWTMTTDFVLATLTDAAPPAWASEGELQHR